SASKRASQLKFGMFAPHPLHSARTSYHFSFLPQFGHLAAIGILLVVLSVVCAAFARQAMPFRRLCALRSGARSTKAGAAAPWRCCRPFQEAPRSAGARARL